MLELDWTGLLRPRQTVAIYMGLSHIRELTATMIQQGASAGLPVAVVENGTRPEQRTVTGTLKTIADDIDRHNVKSPAIIIIGTVVSLASQLAWRDE